MDSVLNWDEARVCKWLSSVGYTGYEKKFQGELDHPSRSQQHLTLTDIR
jgi:SAM domain (Sterile alpha motif)